MSEQELPPGRALDALVAEKVMGMGSQWTVQQQSDGTFKPTGEVWYQCPEFSTDIRDAWRIVEKMRNPDFRLNRDGDWVCWFGGLYTFGGEGKTAPLAICRAALKALRREAE